jgi:hypothetical protein
MNDGEQKPRGINRKTMDPKSVFGKIIIISSTD